MKLLIPIFLVLAPASLIAQDRPQAKPQPSTTARPTDRVIPDALKPWQDWVLREESQAPPLFDHAKQSIAVWPSKLTIKASTKQADFDLSVQVFSPAWLALPGSNDLWPQNVKINGQKAVIIERNGQPATKLQPGKHRISGQILWNSIPQRLTIPDEIGVLELIVQGQPVNNPNWDDNGHLWLKRNRAEAEAEREFLETKIYRVLEDGIPLWLYTEIELKVSGKSREETLGYALPQGWQVATVKSRLPCAIDASGKLRVQARAGKWSIEIKAFRTESIDTIAFSSSKPPITTTEILGFRAKPNFRMVQLPDTQGFQAIDVSQTTFPSKWRNLPVYKWSTATPFQLEEKMRGMGFQKVSGLTVNREFWLDDDGKLMTFRDQIEGTAQQSWRLDASPGQTLGAARMDGEGLLITRNPESDASGIEIRTRNINMQAVGRIHNPGNFPASGWQADVDACTATLHLPPGWRLFAMTGVEWVKGDWLTSWTLLDLFLLLIFTMAVGKLWGWPPALIALVGFGLTFHEPGAPKYLWLLLLIPIAILRVGVEGKVKTITQSVKYITLAVLLLVLIPFIGKQLQGVLYPQLEQSSATHSNPSRLRVSSEGSYSKSNKKRQSYRSKTANLKQDLQARIQTGPAIPTWQWRKITFGWRGPVNQSESVKTFLISPGWQSFLTIIRVIMLILLVAVLLRAKQFLPDSLIPNFLNRSSKTIVALAILGSLYTSASAQQSVFPPQSLLEELHQLLTDSSDTLPRAAEIAKAKLVIKDTALNLTAEVHVAKKSAIPIPGKLPTWSPLSIKVDGLPTRAIARHQDYLWVVLEPGNHQVEVAGYLPTLPEWSWTFLLKPRRVEIQAEDWTITGMKHNQAPEDEIFFARKNLIATSEVAYDRKDFDPAVRIERDLEIGLNWQSKTTVTRLTPNGKAISLSIPLLQGERVLTANSTIKNNSIQIRLGANDSSFTWESELPQTDSLSLKSLVENPWVERWKLQASPVWNAQFRGLAPIYETSQQSLNPVWAPWPGESTVLEFSKPEAIPGATMTVRHTTHQTTIGSRQRVSNLKLNLQASLGQDLKLDLPAQADVTRLKISNRKNPDGKQQPVRRDGDSVIIPVTPGEQIVDLEWKMSNTIGLNEQVDNLELPVEASNINTTLSLPQNRWILWTYGPLRGPAVRLWSILLLSLVGAFVLGRLSSSPLKSYEWVLLAIGFSQVHPASILAVVCLFFLIAWRGTDRCLELPMEKFNYIQIAIVILAIIVIFVTLGALHRGLLGTPAMMILGNGSSGSNLNWFAQRTDGPLPQAGAISVSIWYYRIIMLIWALWLALAGLRWVSWGWQNFSELTLFKHETHPKPPPLSKD